jgi:hypothetical protein
MLGLQESTDALIQPCLEHLRALPFVSAVDISDGLRSDRSVDAWLSIRTPIGEHALPCEIKRTHLRKEVAELLIHRAQKYPGLVVFAPLVGRDLGDLFEHAGINFVDPAGNCHLRIGEQYVARIQGRPAERPRTGRGLRAPAYQTLLALLIQPELIDSPSRTIASATGVSPQTANDLRRRLVELQIVLKTRDHHRWTPGRRKDALALWIAGYTTTLAPSLLIGHFRAQDRDPDLFERRIEPLLDGICEWRYGGGAAANRLTEYYRGERTNLYVHNAPVDLPTRLRLLRAADGPIVLARAPGKLAFEAPHPRCVHPILAYADLLAEGGERAREAAGMIHDRFFKDLDLTS